MDSKTLYVSVTTALKTAAVLAEIPMDDKEWQGVRSAACEIYAHLSAHNPEWPKRSAFLRDCGVWLICDGNW